MIHRDLKPANILINEDTCHARLCDFGLSRGKLLGEAVPEQTLAGLPTTPATANDESEMSLYGTHILNSSLQWNGITHFRRS